MDVCYIELFFLEKMTFFFTILFFINTITTYIQFFIKPSVKVYIITYIYI